MPTIITNGGVYSRSLNRLAQRNVGTTPYNITVGTGLYADGDTVINYTGATTGIINLPTKSSVITYFGANITPFTLSQAGGIFVIIKNNPI
jgi:hypothetical protein